MHKKWKGYFTVEASFILPIVLFLYLMIILAALFLYCRSAISQDQFLLAMRAQRFTQGEDYYGEVIYGAEEFEDWKPKEYVEERLERRKAFYPFFSTEAARCQIEADFILIESRQKGSKQLITKTVKKVNPIKIIREWRKGQNA